jgi:type IV secretory pathway VirB3-like protein
MVCTKLHVMLQVICVTEDDIRYSYFYSLHTNGKIRWRKHNWGWGEIKNLVSYKKPDSWYIIIIIITIIIIIM